MLPPLLITRQSLSSKFSVGLQTKILLEAFPDWRHLYWSGADFEKFDARSARAESLLMCRFGFLKGNSLPARIARGAGLSWWDGDKPKPALERWIRDTYKGKVSMVYVSPIETKDAVRMKAIIDIIGAPFVSHPVDILDKDQMDSPAYQFIVRKAQHVFGITEAICDQLAPLNPSVSVLGFTRNSSPESPAPPPPGAPLRIAMIGSNDVYTDGLSVLNEAVRILKQQGRQITLVYVGRERQAARWTHLFDDKLELPGFLPDDVRDQVLLKCHIAFLPGPLPSPSENTRSAFSVPSRIIDYMALGLPIVATVHPDSATARYMRRVGLDDALGTNTPELVAERIVSLTDPENWQKASELSKRSFDAGYQDCGQVLKSYMVPATPGV